jgi:hypothetical protein
MNTMHTICGKLTYTHVLKAFKETRGPVSMTLYKIIQNECYYYYHYNSNKLWTNTKIQALGILCILRCRMAQTQRLHITCHHLNQWTISVQCIHCTENLHTPMSWKHSKRPVVQSLWPCKLATIIYTFNHFEKTQALKVNILNI